MAEVLVSKYLVHECLCANSQQTCLEQGISDVEGELVCVGVRGLGMTTGHGLEAHATFGLLLARFP
jgi:hypothetical protein